MRMRLHEKTRDVLHDGPGPLSFVQSHPSSVARHQMGARASVSPAADMPLATKQARDRHVKACGSEPFIFNASSEVVDTPGEAIECESAIDGSDNDLTRGNLVLLSAGHPQARGGGSRGQDCEHELSGVSLGGRSPCRVGCNKRPSASEDLIAFEQGAETNPHTLSFLHATDEGLKRRRLRRKCRPNLPSF